MRARLGLCLLLALVAAGVAQAAELPLAEAESELKAAAGLPAKKDNGIAAWRLHVRELEAVFRAAAAQNPSRAYGGLGRCQLLLGQYGDAVASFRRALRMAPNKRAAAADLLRAGQLAAIEKTVRRRLPGGSVVLEILPFPAHRQRSWLVVSASSERKRFTSDPFYENARLRLFRKTRHGMEQVWRSEVLRVELGPRWTNDVRAYVLEEAPPKVVVGEVFYGAGWAPAHLDVFAWREGRLAKVFALDSEESFWIQDLDGDGRHEIGGFRKIGSGLATADMPGWQNIYAYEGGTYVLANARFPKEFVSTGNGIRERLEEHPKDYELLKHLGIYYEIEGDPAAALEAYQRAATMLEASECIPRDLRAGERADISARIRQLTRPPPRRAAVE